MDSNTFKAGDLVEAIAFGGKTILRRVVEIADNTIYICREDEWQAAKSEGREPECVGFNRQFVRSAKATNSQSLA